MSLVVVAFLLSLSIAPVSAPPGYERAWAAIPERHRATVREIRIDRDSGGQARRETMSVHLTPHRQDSQLHHEIGHIVMYADPKLEADWRSSFWPSGRIRGIPPSRYARTNYREDFAESYSEVLEHGCVEDVDRTQFMKERVFRSGEIPYPCLD